MKNIDPNFFSKTKKARRVQILGVPLYLNMSKNEIKELFNEEICNLYLNEPGNKNPIHLVELNHLQNSVILEMTSIEEASRLFKLSELKFLGKNCKVNRCNESMFGEEDNLVSKMQSAQVY